MVLWSAAAGAEPPHAQTLTPYQEGELFLGQKMPGEALNIYRRLLEQEQDPRAARGLVRSYEGLGKLEEAEKHLRGLLAEHPGSAPLLYGLGLAAYLRGNWSEADKQLRGSLERDPANALAWNTLGSVAGAMNDPTTGVAHAKKAIEIDPENAVFYNNLQLLYQAMKRPDGLLRDFEEAVKSGGETHPRALGYGKALARTIRQDGFKLYNDGNTRAAIAKFEEVARIYRKIHHDPGLVAGLFSLGLLHEELGEDARAQAYYKEVLSISPEHIQARERLESGP